MSEYSIVSAKGFALIIATVGVVLALLFQLLSSKSSILERQNYVSNKVIHSKGCTVERVLDITCEDFVNTYLGKRPIVIRRSTTATRNLKTFAKICERDHLSQRYADLPARISTANAYTGREWLETTLGEYLEKLLGPQSATNPRGNETFYFFGSQSGDDWEDFLTLYTSPIYPSESLRLKIKTSVDANEMSNKISEQRGKTYCGNAHLVDRTLSFGIAGRNTGVPFHFHGPGFLEMLHGRKRFLLYPPKHLVPLYDPNVTTLHWTRESLPLLQPGNLPFDCILEPGDIIYFPDEWLHATLNLDEYNVFMATFA